MLIFSECIFIMRSLYFNFANFFAWFGW